MRALNDVIESGKVRYIGASSMAAWEFQTLQNIAERKGWHKFISMQNYYNLLYREEEREMVSSNNSNRVSRGLLRYFKEKATDADAQIPYCNDTNVGLIPWSPIARGALTRPWSDRNSSRAQTDKFLDFLVHSREDKVDQEIVKRVEEVAKKNDVSMACIATAWCVKKGVCPIIGMNKKERIDEAVKNVAFKLSDEDAKYLEEPYLPKVRQGF